MLRLVIYYDLLVVSAALRRVERRGVRFVGSIFYLMGMFASLTGYRNMVHTNCPTIEYGMSFQATMQVKVITITRSNKLLFKQTSRT